MSDNHDPNEGESPTTDQIPVEPGERRHAILTAVAVAEELHKPPVTASEIIDAADELGFLGEYTRSSILRRLPMMHYHQGLLDQHGEVSFKYSLAEDGRTELDEHGRYGGDR